MRGLVVLALCAAVVSGARVLVMHEDAVETSHSQFLSGLEGRGHDITFKTTMDTDIELKQYGELVYDNILLLAPTLEDLGNLVVGDLLAFMEDGGNVMVTVSEELGSRSPLRDFAAECGVDFDRKGSIVMDHVKYHPSDPFSDHSLIVTDGFTRSTHVVGDAASGAPVVFRGIGNAVDDDNILAIRTLTGSSSTYSARPHKPVGSYPESAGKQVGLVTSVQARNNARVTFVGSFWMLSDDAFGYSVSGSPVGNAAFADNVAKWTFGEQGVLRTSNIRHSRADGSQPDTQLSNKEQPNLPVSIYPHPEVAPDSLVYRIKDDLVYKVDMEVLSGDGEGFGPFAADDVQLEFVMLDAYVRVNMEHDGKGTFTAKFKAPDTYGIYKFRVLYRRPGLSIVDLSTQVSIRPFRHNEYERFISSAFPYYASVVSMMVGFFVFSWFFLFSSA